jgi:hypothetical protein
MRDGSEKQNDNYRTWKIKNETETGKAEEGITHSLRKEIEEHRRKRSKIVK